MNGGMLMKQMTVTHDQVHLTLMTLRRVKWDGLLSQRSGQLVMAVESLWTLITPEPPKRF